MKSVTGSNKTSAIPPLRHDGHIYKASEKAQLLNNMFAANSQLDDDGKTLPKLRAKTNATLSSLKFRPKVVLKKLRTHDMSKANGPDGISSTVLKKWAPELAPVLVKLLQISFDTRTDPSEWKTAHVIGWRIGVSMIHQTTNQYRCYQLYPNSWSASYVIRSAATLASITFFVTPNTGFGRRGQQLICFPTSRNNASDIQQN